MKLSKLYSNRSDTFIPLEFNNGLSVILSEMRLPENKNKDTHNVGKSTYRELINFCLLSGIRDKQDFFLTDDRGIFKGYVFYLEIELSQFSYLTVARSADNNTKISFKKHDDKLDADEIFLMSWDHEDVAFDKAKILLDGYLNLDGVKNVDCREVLSYFLRAQSDFDDIFKLAKYQRSKDRDWKPVLASILGFNSKILSDSYKIKEDIVIKNKEKSILEKQLTDPNMSITSITSIDSTLLIERHNARELAKQIDSFNFKEQDAEHINSVVYDIDNELSDLALSLYRLNAKLKEIDLSLSEDKILFKPDNIKKLFQEAGIFFKDDLKKSYEDLIAFNKAITSERIGYLKKEKANAMKEIESITVRQEILSTERSEKMSFLSDTEPFEKFRVLSKKLAKMQAKVAVLEQEREKISILKNLKEKIDDLQDQKQKLDKRIKEDVESKVADENSVFSQIVIDYNGIIRYVLDRDAKLYVDVNGQGNIEFKTTFLNDKGIATKEAKGFSYMKFLCIAFDLALLRVYSTSTSTLNLNFPYFVYHDGIFDSLDDRKKEKLLEVLRECGSSTFNIQNIVTLLDSDIPKYYEAIGFFKEEEIIRILHDGGSEGRAFNMDKW